MGDENDDIWGWLTVDDPFHGQKPAEQEVVFLEEIVSIISRKVHEIKYLMRLNTEREALHEKNATLENLLAAFEKERKTIKKKIANRIDRIAIPAIDNLQKQDGTVNPEKLRILRHRLQNISNENTDYMERFDKLTPREIEVCNYIREGLSTKEIALNLNISKRTVESIRKSIRKKLGLSHTKTNLAAFLTKFKWV
jgi:DNA-binding CsgD family transcriptional regulator